MYVFVWLNFVGVLFMLGVMALVDTPRLVGVS